MSASSTPAAVRSLEGADRAPGVARKADLQEAALRLFSEKGYNGSSLQEIADEIGILKGSLYYYYQSKQDLLFDVVKRVHDEMLDNARSLAAEPGPPLRRLHNLLSGHAVFICDNLDRARVFLRELDRLPEDKRLEILGADHDYQRVFRNVIAAAQAEGEVSAAVNPKLASLWILGSLNWLHQWYRPERPGGSLEIARTFADQLTRGLEASALWDNSGPILG